MKRLKKGPVTHELRLVIAITRRTILFAFAVFLVVWPTHLTSESIVLSTTYPSPVGIYNRIITTGNPASAPNNNTILARDGGFVGIGVSAPIAKLDVAGGIRPGDQNAVPTCSASTAGMMRYDSSVTPPAIEFCSNPNGNPTGPWVFTSIANAPVKTGLYGTCSQSCTTTSSGGFGYTRCSCSSSNSQPPASCNGQTCSCSSQYQKTTVSFVPSRSGGCSTGTACVTTTSSVISCYKN